MAYPRTAVELLLRCLSVSRKPSAVSRQPSADWNEVADVAVGHGLAPLLFKRLKKSDARADVPTDVWERLRLAYFSSARRSKRLYRELGSVLRCLRGSGIPVIGLKGAFVAEAVYGDIALRPMCDVDLLVPRAELPRALAVLLDMGGVHRQSEDIESLCRKRHHLPSVVVRDLHVELHWTITPPTLPVRMDAAGFWDRAHPATIAGVGVLALSPEDLLLHVCLHFGCHNCLAGLKSFCDVAETIHRFHGEMDPEVRYRTTETTENLGIRSEPRSSSNSVSSVASVVDSILVPGIDWPQFVGRAREWGAGRYVGLTLHLARSLLVAEVPDDVLEQLVPGGLDQRLLETAKESVLTETGYGPWMPIFQLRGARTLGDKVELLRNRIFLSRDQMAAIYPACYKSRHLHFYYALRLRDVIRAYWSHTLRRGLPAVRSRGQDRNVALVNWLKEDRRPKTEDEGRRTKDQGQSKGESGNGRSRRRRDNRQGQ